MVVVAVVVAVGVVVVVVVVDRPVPVGVAVDCHAGFFTKRSLPEAQGSLGELRSKHIRKMQKSWPKLGQWWQGPLI